MGKYDIIDKHYREGREVLADLIGAELHERCERFPEFVLPVRRKVGQNCNARIVGRGFRG